MVNTILTDDEIKTSALEAFDCTWDADDETLVNKYGHGTYLWRFTDFARAIETAVLAKLREQEPVAWMRARKWAPPFDIHTGIGDPDEVWPSNGHSWQPLYAAPQPAVVQVPQIDYEALIAAAFAADKKWAQGTNGCIAFKHGAEWFRDQVLAAAPEVSSTADRIAELEQQLKAYEAHGVTCQTFRHFVDTPCAECNVRAPEAPAQGVIAWACWPDGQPLTAGNMQLSKDEPTAYTNRVRLIPEAPAPAVVQVPTLPFAVFDEFGNGCEDRVRDHFAAAPKAPAQTYICTETMHTEIPCPKCKPLPALPTDVREAIKVAREALAEEKRVRLLGQEPDVHWESMRDVRRACYAATDAALARLDALGGVE